MKRLVSNSNSLDSDLPVYCKQFIKKKISSFSREQFIEVLRIFDKAPDLLSRNSNGIFINLKNVPNPILWEIYNFVKFTEKKNEKSSITIQNIIDNKNIDLQFEAKNDTNSKATKKITKKNHLYKKQVIKVPKIQIAKAHKPKLGSIGTKLMNECKRNRNKNIVSKTKSHHTNKIEHNNLKDISINNEQESLSSEDEEDDSF